MRTADVSRSFGVFAPYCRPLVLLALALATVSLTPPGARAQGEPGALLEELVVTARKRSESIQDVPVAVTALTAGQIERGTLNTMVDLKKLAPNVEMVAQPFAGGALSASIRGVGLDDLEKTFEPTVAVSIDGVFLASTAGANVDFFDVESVEVLRGPQGTLFGRNTIGGVINVTRSKPTKALGARLQATFDEFSREDFQAIVNFPLGDKGGVKIGARSLKTDAFARNVTRGETPKNRDLSNSSVSLLYDFTDNFSAQFTWDNYNDNSRLIDQLNISSRGNDPASPDFNPNDARFRGANAFALLGPNFGAAGSGDLSAANEYSTTYSGGQFFSTIQGNNYALTLNGAAGDYDLKFIANRMETKEEMDICSWGARASASLFPFGTGTPANPGPCYFPVRRQQEFAQESAELQVISNYQGPINFVAGLYYLASDAPFKTDPVQVIESLQELQARALYGEIIWNLAENWELTAGARYTDEEKDFYVDARGTSLQGGANLDFNDDETTYRLIVERKFDFGMLYASYSTGFRSGGFNARGNTPNTVGPYESETVNSAEIGLRSQFLDNRLTLNLTYFDSAYKDKQEQVVTAGDGSFEFEGQPENCAGPTCTFVFNAGEVSTRGVEVEGAYLAANSLLLRLAIGTLDAQYDKFDYAGRGDISKIAQVIYAPELTVSLGFEYIADIFAGELTLNGNFKHTDDSWGRTDWATYDPVYGPDVLIDSFATLDLSAQYARPMRDGQVRLRLYATDVLKDGGRIARPFDAGAFAFADIVARRTLGASIAYEF